jgi:ankyrin repeat protein
MQVRTPVHTNQSNLSKEFFEKGERCMGGDEKRFFKLFQESTFEGSRAAAREMKKIAKRQTKQNQKIMLFHSLYFLARSKSEMLSWPNSPLLVILQFVDPNMLSGDEREPLQEGQAKETPLHQLVFLVDPFDYSNHENQLILAKQLIEHSANVNAVSIPNARTPLHSACDACIVTNLDFVELLLKSGGDPNAQDPRGLTPLMCTTKHAPGAAKFLLNWPTTDANMTNRSGESFLFKVRKTVKFFTNKIAIPDSPDQVQHQFLLQQWIASEEMLVKRGAVDTGITTLG